MRAPATVLVVLSAAVVASGCERPPVESVQTGFRGTGMVHVDNPRSLRDSMESQAARIPEIPEPTAAQAPPAPPGTWENVQVLGHLSQEEFDRTMLALTAWVSPEQGCNYCHVSDAAGEADFASDDIYTKVVSRQMLRMVQDANMNWSEHVGEDRVSCFTCHMGKPVPTNFWYYTDENQSLRHLLDRDDIRVVSDEALSEASENRTSLKQTEYTYDLMLKISDALGVNCTFCHNSPRFVDWEESPPQRITALRGIEMTRALNTAHLLPLQDEWPEERMGPLGDGPKLDCASCHNGAFQPQYGATSAAGFPALTEMGRPHPTGEGNPDSAPALQEPDPEEER